MEWEKLLNTKRVSELTSCGRDSKKSQYEDPRNPFERDCDQIIYSYPFRRLQDKTQVIPFPEYDFVHTRLTHSLEVATVGRSLGILAGNFIKEKGELPKGMESNYLGDLVAGACLAHDIGNPPFGHSGEDSISNYFIEKELVNILDHSTVMPTNDDIKKWHDLSRFEGNANGFRILLNCQDKGINPTLALLGVFSKYPRESFISADVKDGNRVKLEGKSLSKYGFFQSEKSDFIKIANELGLICSRYSNTQDQCWQRHPLAFIMESADDICYQMIDFEDGCRVGIINYLEPYELELESGAKVKVSPKEILISLANKDNGFDQDFFEKIEGNYSNEIGYLRSKIINVLIHECYRVWEENYTSIMSGEFDKELIKQISDTTINDGLEKMKLLIKKLVYSYRPVLESEAAGFEVVNQLIESFAISASICESCGDDKSKKMLKFESLLPIEYRPVDNGSTILSFEEKYLRYLKILDYVSGMTDGYAINLYRKIKGISLPNR